MDSNTIVKIRMEIVGQGTVFPAVFHPGVIGIWDKTKEKQADMWNSPVLTTRLGTTTDFTFIPETGWKCSGGVYLRPLSQKAGRTPEYAWGSAMPIDSLRTMKGGDNMANGTPRFHLSIGPEGVVRELNTINGDTEFILRVEFVPTGAVPPSYTGPATLEDLAAQLKSIDARLKVVEAK